MTFLPQKIKKDKLMPWKSMPDSIDDIISNNDFYYDGDLRLEVNMVGGRSVYHQTDKSAVPRKIVDAIKSGDLQALKAINPADLKKYLDKAILKPKNRIIKGIPGKDEVSGFTPLMLVALEGKTDMMRYLMDMGADIGMKTYDLGFSFKTGTTAADYLRHYKDNQKAKSEKQKQRDELNDLMDEVDGNKKPLQPKIDEKYRLDKENGRQFGNGRGLDDKIAKESDKLEKVRSTVSKKKLMPRAE